MRTNGNTTSVEPVHLTGKTIAHSYTWSEAKRIKLAAKATFGAVVVTPLTAIQAAAVFDVPATAIAAELKKLGRPAYEWQRPRRQRQRPRYADVGLALERAAVGILAEEFRFDRGRAGGAYCVVEIQAPARMPALVCLELRDV
jgi:hypothetical protein